MKSNLSPQWREGIHFSAAEMGIEHKLKKIIGSFENGIPQVILNAGENNHHKYITSRSTIDFPRKFIHRIILKYP